MKVFFIGVFDNNNVSTNNSQAWGLAKLGHEVTGYSFRHRIAAIGLQNVCFELPEEISNVKPDLVLVSKCAELPADLIRSITETGKRNNYKTCYWYMDPPSSVNDDILLKSSLCTYSTIAWKGNLEEFSEYNKNCHVVIEGFDSNTDKPHVNQEKKFDVSFIGSLHSNRQQLLSNLDPGVTIVQNAFAEAHAEAVGASRINLNVSTSGGASDRVFKVLAAGGFLMTNDFVGREDMFEDGEHLVIWKDKKDLQKKITWYLKNQEVMEEIAASGLKQVQQFNRIEWARQIVEYAENA